MASYILSWLFIDKFDPNDDEIDAVAVYFLIENFPLDS